MPTLQPSEPPAVRIEILPVDTVLVTAHADSSVRGGVPARSAILHLTVYLPDGYADITHEEKQSSLSNYDRYCSDCDLNFQPSIIPSNEVDKITEVLEADDPDFRFRILSIRAESVCPYANGGDNSFDNGCFKGYDGDADDDDPETEVEEAPPMAFRIMVGENLNKISESVWLQAVNPNNCLEVTYRNAAMNTWDRTPPEICWGGNVNPYTLADVVRSYLDSPCNDDLTKWDDYKDKADDIRACVLDDNYTANLWSCDGAKPEHSFVLGHHPEANDARCDAIIIAAMSSLNTASTAFIQLRASGAPTVSTVMPNGQTRRFCVIQAWHHNHALPDGTTIAGFRTAPVADGSVCWFITPVPLDNSDMFGHEGQLIGQIPVPQPITPVHADH